MGRIKQLFFKLKIFFFEVFYTKFFDNKKIFEFIYKTNYWGSSISKSGPGSEATQTINIKNNLPIIIDEYKIKSLFDAPCGDFVWMNKILFRRDILYLGGDVVNPLIHENILKHKTKNINFQRFDLRKDKFPIADLWICRALFFHLSFRDINKIMSNFENAPIKYFMITNSVTSIKHKNIDIRSGGYRRLDLFKEPFNFPKNFLVKFDDTYFNKTDQVDQEMILWEKNKFFKDFK